jgi:hypothetical protein
MVMMVMHFALDEVAFHVLHPACLVATAHSFILSLSLSLSLSPVINQRRRQSPVILHLQNTQTCHFRAILSLTLLHSHRQRSQYVMCIPI